MPPAAAASGRGGWGPRRWATPPQRARGAIAAGALAALAALVLLLAALRPACAALGFNGAASRAEAAIPGGEAAGVLSAPSSQALTLELWFRVPGGRPAGSRMLLAEAVAGSDPATGGPLRGWSVGLGDMPTTYRSIQIGVPGTCVWLNVTSNGTTLDAFHSPARLLSACSDSWCHLAVSLRRTGPGAGVASVALNGTVTRSGPVALPTAAAPLPAASLRLGAFGAPLSGQLRAVRLYPAALSADAIACSFATDGGGGGGGNGTRPAPLLRIDGPGAPLVSSGVAVVPEPPPSAFLAACPGPAGGCWVSAVCGTREPQCKNCSAPDSKCTAVGTLETSAADRSYASVEPFLTGGNITVETWVNVRSILRFGRIWDFSNGPGAPLSGQLLQLKIWTDDGNAQPEAPLIPGLAYGQVIVRPGSYTDSRLFAFPLNTWTHIAVSIAATDRISPVGQQYGLIRVYVDGTLVHELAPFVETNGNLMGIALPPRVPRRLMYIGASTQRTGNGWIDASIAEFRLWDRARSAEEIRCDFRRALTGAEAGLASYLRFPAGGPGRAGGSAGSGSAADLVDTRRAVTLHGGARWGTAPDDLLVKTDVAVESLRIVADRTEATVEAPFVLSAAYGEASDVRVEWRFGDGASSPSSSGRVVSHAFGAEGTYVVTATASNGVSSLTASLVLSVVPPAVDRLSVEGGPAVGGTRVTLYGRNFLRHPKLACRFGEQGSEVPAEYLSEAAIACQAPPHPPAVLALSVSNNGGAFFPSAPLFTFAGCPPGYESSSYLLPCSPCPRGRYGVGGSAKEGRLGDCLPCSNGTYSGDPGAAACTPCPPRSTSPTGALSVDSCLCLPGTFGDPAASVPCSPCGPGTLCEAGTRQALALPGYWIASGQSGARRCSPPEACPGGLQTCAEGYAEEGCSRCVRGPPAPSAFYRLQGRCYPCSVGDPVAVIALIPVAVAALWMLLYAASATAPTPVGALFVEFVLFVQFLAMLGNANARWTAPLARLVEVLSFANLEPQLLRPECLGVRDSFRAQWAAVLLSPPAFLLVTAAACGLAAAWRAIRAGRASSPSSSSLGRARPVLLPLSDPDIRGAGNNNNNSRGNLNSAGTSLRSFALLRAAGAGPRRPSEIDEASEGSGLASRVPVPGQPEYAAMEQRSRKRRASAGSNSVYPDDGGTPVPGLGPAPESSSAWPLPPRRIATTILQFLHLAYLQIAASVLEIFSCAENSDGRRYMRAAPSVQCSDVNGDWTSLRPAAIAAIAIYVCGIPVLLAGLAWRDTARLKRVREMRARRAAGRGDATSAGTAMARTRRIPEAGPLPPATPVSRDAAGLPVAGPSAPTPGGPEEETKSESSGGASGGGGVGPHSTQQQQQQQQEQRLLRRQPSPPPPPPPPLGRHLSALEVQALAAEVAAEENERRPLTAFLAAGLRPGREWWFLVVLARRVAVVIVNVFTWDTVDLQMTANLAVVAVSLTLQVWFRPYVAGPLNAFAFASLFVHLYVLFAGIILVGVPLDSLVAATLTGTVLLLVIGAAVAFLAAIALHAYYLIVLVATDRVIGPEKDGVVRVPFSVLMAAYGGPFAAPLGALARWSRFVSPAERVRGAQFLMRTIRTAEDWEAAGRRAAAPLSPQPPLLVALPHYTGALSHEDRSAIHGRLARAGRGPSLGDFLVRKFGPGRLLRRRRAAPAPASILLVDDEGVRPAAAP